MADMERVHKIQNHPVFRDLYKKLEESEKDRIFCRHTMEHFLDVARLMYIYSLEDKAGLSKEVIYAAALLHDIGRYEQVTAGTPHDIAGARIAGEILKECGFTEAEIIPVVEAIMGHRNQKSGDSGSALTAYLYRADKKSRSCFACPALSECNWPEEKKNLTIMY